MSRKDQNRISPEGLQLVECVRAYIAGGSASVVMDINDENACGRLFALAFSQKLVPVVFDTLSGCEAVSKAAYAEGWRSAAKRQAVMQTYLASELCDILSRLKQKGFEPIVLKGELCRRLYKKPELRISSDEDLFIEEDKAEACLCAMAEMGFCEKYGEKPEWRGREVVTADSPEGPHIELHRALFKGDGRIDAAFDKHFASAFARSVRDTGGAGEIRVFRPTDALLYLICHAAKHFASGGFGVRTAADISAFTERHYDDIDMEELCGLLDKGGLARFAAAVYGIAVKHFGFDISKHPLPEALMGADGEAMLADCLSGGVYGTATPARAQSAKYTIAAASGGSRTGAALRSIFPGREALAAEYPFVKKSALLVPAAWVKRIFAYVRSGRGDGQQGYAIGRRRARLLKKYGIEGKKGS